MRRFTLSTISKNTCKDEWKNSVEWKNNNSARSRRKLVYLVLFINKALSSPTNCTCDLQRCIRYRFICRLFRFFKTSKEGKIINTVHRAHTKKIEHIFQLLQSSIVIKLYYQKKLRFLFWINFWSHIYLTFDENGERTPSWVMYSFKISGDKFCG